MKRLNISLTLLIIIFSTVQNAGQVNDRTSHQSDEMRVEAFRPPIFTIVVVKLSKERKYPTSFELKAPHVNSTKIDYKIVGKVTSEWLEQHPNSKAVEIYRLPVFPNGKKEYGIVSYVWVVDKNEKLNIQLVQRGACEARTFLLDDEDDLLINKKDYEEFKRKVIEAEEQAKKKNLGIWGFKRRGMDKH
jgi:hypothetical protein